MALRRRPDGCRPAHGAAINRRLRTVEGLSGGRFVLGKFAAEAGHGVILSSYVVEHHIGSATLQQNVEHRLRWARSTRRSRPAGYVGQLFYHAPAARAAGLRCMARMVASFASYNDRARGGRLTRFPRASCGQKLTGRCCLSKTCWAFASGSRDSLATRFPGEGGATGSFPMDASN